MILKTASLTPEVLRVIRDKGTEHPFSGEYDEFDESGTYICKQCGKPLFRSHTKFHSGCGWPSFDDEIPGAIRKEQDADGMRTEILCARCNAHLGHIFAGEQLTARNLRYCVNSLSLEFISDLKVNDTEEAIFAGGCFWGVEFLFKQLAGVLKTEVGYTGGRKDHPTYEEVCTGRTGHYEAIRVIYNPELISFEDLAKYFFEIHNPSQNNGQGPDIGQQYLSSIFYYDDNQKKIALNLIQQLEKKGYSISTQLLPAAIFWRAETYHQNYYHKTGKLPYCHIYQKKF